MKVDSAVSEEMEVLNPKRFLCRVVRPKGVQLCGENGAVALAVWEGLRILVEQLWRFRTAINNLMLGSFSLQGYVVLVPCWVSLLKSPYCSSWLI